MVYQLGQAWNVAVIAYSVYMQAAGRSPGTCKLHRHYLAQLARTVPASPWLALPADLLDVLATPGWAPETRKSCRGAFRSFYGWGCQAGHCEHNPAADLPTVRVPAAVPRPTPESVLQQALLDAAPREQLMLSLAAFAGLRCAEIAQVHSRDVRDGWLRVHGKGGKVREVPLLPSLQQRLDQVDGYAFPGPTRGHLSAGHVSRLLSTNLPAGWTGHTLRHRMATRAYDGTRDLLAVSALLGHSRPETTQRYVQLPGDALRLAVAAAGHVLTA